MVCLITFSLTSHWETFSSHLIKFTLISEQLKGCIRDYPANFIWHKKAPTCSLEAFNIGKHHFIPMHFVCCSLSLYPL